MISDFISGAGYFLRGIKLIKQPGVRRFVIIPFLVNLIVFSLAIWFGISEFRNLLDWLLPDIEAWWIEYLRGILWIIFTTMIVLIVFFTFSLIANLFGAPFNGLLSEKVEGYLLGRTDQASGGIRDFAEGILKSVYSEMRKIIYFLILGGSVFILTLIPVVNFISPFLWLLFSSWMLAIEYIAYPMENNKIYFSRVKTELRKRRSISLGFGIAVLAATMIPLVNFAVMPAAVAGSTAMWVEQFSHLKTQ